VLWKRDERLAGFERYGVQIVLNVIPVTFSFFAGIVTAASYAIWGIPGPAQHAEIRKVIPGSSAERGGLADGDVVIAIEACAHHPPCAIGAVMKKTTR
jgi:hypothetical protein